jgi:hypothetical protein
MKKEIEELKGIISKNQGSNEKRFEVIFSFLDNVNGGFMPPSSTKSFVTPTSTSNEIKETLEKKVKSQQQKQVTKTIQELLFLILVLT